MGIDLFGGRCWLWDTRNPSNTSIPIWLLVKQGFRVKKRPSCCAARENTQLIPSFTRKPSRIYPVFSIGIPTKTPIKIQWLSHYCRALPLPLHLWPLSGEIWRHIVRRRALSRMEGRAEWNERGGTPRGKRLNVTSGATGLLHLSRRRSFLIAQN